MKLQYPVLLEKPQSENEAWGIIVPDLPGCFSAADNENDILDKAREAILLHLESLNEIPRPSHLSEVYQSGFITSLVDVDLSGFQGVAKRINITVPAAILARIDRAAMNAGKSRSAYLVESALHEANR